VTTTEYRVHLEAFEGPLDLLLYLIKRAEVDIRDIPIGTIADQYVEYLKGVDRIDIELAGEFLLMAASLMEIKSRMLAPRPEGAEGVAGDQVAAAIDPRAGLVRQLLEYKAARDAADALEARRSEWERRFPARAIGVEDERLGEAIAGAEDLELDDLNLVDLVNAFNRIMETVNFDRLGDHEIKYDDTPIELHAEDLVDQLKRRLVESPERPGMTLVEIFKGRTRSEAIGLFLAVLELVKNQRAVVKVGEGGVEVGLKNERER